MTLSDDELNKLYRYCLALTCDPDTAHDLLHDGYEKWLGLTILQRKCFTHSKLSYAKTLIRNHWYDQLRRKQKMHDILADQVVDQVDVDNAIELGENSLESIMITRQTFDHVWQILSISDREILFLWAVEGHTINEISAIIQIKRGTLLSRIHRIKQRVRQSSVTTSNDSGLNKKNGEKL